MVIGTFSIQTSFCCCGREKSHHSQEAHQGSGGSWSLQYHVVPKETNARGEIEFHGTSRKTRAKVSTLCENYAKNVALECRDIKCSEI